jgi:hypothetical protein
MRLLAFALCVFAAGCGYDSGTPVTSAGEWIAAGNGIAIRLVRIEGTRCVVMYGYKSGGISCDWK